MDDLLPTKRCGGKTLAHQHCHEPRGRNNGGDTHQPLGSPLMWDDVGMLVDVVEVDVQTWSVLSDEHS